MRNISTWIFCLLYLFSQNALSGSISAYITPEKFTAGMIWKIESGNIAPSYLMGTIHVDDPQVRALFAQAAEQFNKAETVCTEVKLDFKAVAAELEAMFFSDGQTLESVLNDKAFYQQTVKLAGERGFPEAMVRHMKPFALMFMLSMPHSEGEMLDAKIYTDAIRQGKQVCGLETLEEHGNVFKSFEMPDQIKMLRITIENIDEVDRLYPLLLKAYLDRDLVKLVDLVNNSMKLHDEAIETIFTQRLLIDRNKKMFMRMQPLIKKGNAFFAVGAMHLTGKAGLLRLLEAQGYTLTVVH